MTRNDCLVLSNAVDVGLNNAAKESRVQVAGIIAVSVAGGRDARVDAGSVAVPKIHVDGRHRLASAGVDKLDVEIKGHALLAVDDVAPQQLAVDIIRPLSDLGLQNAGRVVREERGLVVAIGSARGRLVGGVVGGKISLRHGFSQTSLGPSLASHLLATGES